MTTAPFGSWRSPITARDLAESGHPVAGGAWVGDEAWWLELKPAEGGRYAVRRNDAHGRATDVLPPPWNARSRVHEYGGTSWAGTDAGDLVFAEFTDQRLYRLAASSADPQPLTPPDLGFRFVELSIHDGNVLAVRETHSGGEIVRDIVAVPLDGSAAESAEAIRRIVSGSRFLASARFSPDGRHLAWIAWEHPQLPWDGTELRIGDVVGGAVTEWRTIAGSTTESMLQPEWTDDEHLVAISDASGWWNLVRIGLDGTRVALHEDEAEFGGPLWTLGTRWFDLLDDGRILAVRTSGDDALLILDPATGSVEQLDVPLSLISLGARRRERVLLGGGSPTVAAGLRVLNLGTAALHDVRLSVDTMHDTSFFSKGEARTFVRERDVHAFVFPPANPDFEAPPGELAPYIAFVHGGPTARVSAVFDPTVAYFTSRGIGVLNVNYGGSTGYGREYRERLRGQWGVVDVEDTIAAVLGLADAGLADRNRLAIRGGSAGGWTVLAALTSSDVFAAGTSYFGVAELTQFARDTHDFESRYLDGLIGPLPEAAALYESRAPVNNVHRLATPVLLLQGLDDPVVLPSQAEMFRDALAERGIRHAYVAYEGESHGFRRAETIVHATEAELSFYGQVLGFEPPDVPVLPLVEGAQPAIADP